VSAPAPVAQPAPASTGSACEGPRAANETDVPPPAKRQRLAGGVAASAVGGGAGAPAAGAGAGLGRGAVVAHTYARPW
jgi:hypothetical protein